MSSNLPARRRPDPIDSHVGQKIRMQRLLLHMSQTELAKALGVTYQQVQKYENGRTRVSASRLQAIANVLEVPLTFFFESSASDHSDDAGLGAGRSMVEFVSSPMGLALNRAFSRIADVRVRRSFLGLVQRLAEDDGTHTGSFASLPPGQ
ncbi:Cro/Cl family transcriptional regulator [Sinorhizobium fredii USDA 205]|uniref:Helix-turn-helix domain-containing protein n=1 Tax=Rhizobium fredii TaxID=380 RepID=A0A844AK33_RHIFR|nr:helix-turn-helix transcriptional regulator [Sinorhizobium fredii]KSV86925.1 Cro/Cl family transcriptional regulator [Sinorhizobium fredii USDA 205]MQW95566.1 helix-turn-helix domain-containing protein [Sinorhizobium fredii]MQX11630.1 helix-turn-helix domain-containing protein [Sinorhizobium fredii]UTY45516.1 XRE family transcriptional regulator [Sinorhizobium fredii]